jgi:hypothetical protein
LTVMAVLIAAAMLAGSEDGKAVVVGGAMDG